MFKCFFGHKFTYKQVGDAYIKECLTCREQFTVPACEILGHVWKDTGQGYTQTRHGYDGQWITKTKMQQCARCQNTREVDS